MSRLTENTPFEGTRSTDLLWARDGGKGDEPEVHHIIGPRMPRMYPVSPTYLAPCGYLTWTDSMHDSTYEPGAKFPMCVTCKAFADQLAREERDAKDLETYRRKQSAP